MEAERHGFGCWGGCHVRASRSCREPTEGCPTPYPLQRAIVYGSHAKGTLRYASDIDLTLIAPEMTHWQLLELEPAIDDLLPWKVDLSL